MKSSSLTFTPFSLWLSKLDSSYKKMNTGKACDEGEPQQVLLSTIYHPDGKDPEMEYIPLYGDMTYYVPEFPERYF